MHDAWDPKELLSLVVMTPEQRELAAADLHDRAAGPGVPLSELERAVIERLAEPLNLVSS